VITRALYARLAGDATLTAQLATYEGRPAIFMMDPAPGDAVLPYIVAAGAIAQTPWDTKTTRGREITRDVRCYAPAGGSVVTVEAIAERVRTLLHRQPLTTVAGFVWVLADCSGPVVADEQNAYGRILTIRWLMEEV